MPSDLDRAIRPGKTDIQSIALHTSSITSLLCSGFVPTDVIHSFSCRTFRRTGCCAGIADEIWVTPTTQNFAHRRIRDCCAELWGRTTECREVSRSNPIWPALNKWLQQMKPAVGGLVSCILNMKPPTHITNWARSEYIFSTDHKSHGIQYLITAMAMAMLEHSLAADAFAVGLSRPPCAVHGEDLPGRLCRRHNAAGVLCFARDDAWATIMVFFLFRPCSPADSEISESRSRSARARHGVPFPECIVLLGVFFSCIVIFGALFVTGGAPLGDGHLTRTLECVPAYGPGQDYGVTMWITAIAAVHRFRPDGGLNTSRPS